MVLSDKISNGSVNAVTQRPQAPEPPTKLKKMPWSQVVARKRTSLMNATFENNIHNNPVIDHILKDGITFENDAVKLLSCRALDPVVPLVRLRLSNLPFLKEDILKEQLKMSLEPHGFVLDLGILQKLHTSTYMDSLPFLTIFLDTSQKMKAFMLCRVTCPPAVATVMLKNMPSLIVQRKLKMEKTANDMDGDTVGNYDADDDDGNNIPLLHDDVYRLKLSLSGIVNTIRRSDFDHVRPFLPTQHLDERLDAIVAQFCSHVITNNTKTLLQQVIDTFVQGGSIEETMVLVHDLQRPLLLAKQCASQAYRALDAVAAILKIMGFYNNSDTVATVLHRFMTILSSIFSSITSIKLTEGETTSACTKSIQRLNVALYEASQSQSFGRKIDILVKHDQGSSKYIELSSLENKNLRTNGAILAYLSSLNPRCRALQTTAAIDFIGSAGYIYVMTNIDGIFYARQVGLIMLPKSRGTFVHLTETMDLLFAFEAFMTCLGHEAQAALEHRESLDNICEVANVLQECIPSPHHDIFITPTRHK
ncbi:hypothetical protein G6F66_000611 [Rhizopus arrhizus]|nr:hypothetical protein G6F66_000611 [Rhizopus arrhizus]